MDDSFSKSLRKFEFYSQKIWPYQRKFSMGIISPRCRKCTISSLAPDIHLEKGICNLCLEFQKPKDAEEVEWDEKYLDNQRKELHKILTEYQGKGKRRYDALMLFSGGKDSTYLLYKLRTEYPALRLLLITWNNGFYSEIALENVRKIVKKLDIDHIIYKPRSSVFKSLYRYTLTHINEQGSYGTVDRFDGTLNQHLGIRFAAELEIPIVISGIDWAQSLIMGSLTHFEEPPEEMMWAFNKERMIRRSKLKIEEILSAEDRELYWDGSKWPLERTPKFIAPLIALRPSKSFVASSLAKAGLLRMTDLSPLLTNNKVLPLMTAIDIKKIGYCSFEPEFAAMIRLKSSDPTYWRNVFEFSEYLVKKNKFFIPPIINILHSLGLTKKDVGLD